MASFSWALGELKAGKRVRRKLQPWPTPSVWDISSVKLDRAAMMLFLMVETNSGVDAMMVWHPDQDDILADDWEIEE